MNLSAEAFQSIVDSIRSDGKTDGGDERRVSPRAGFRGRINIIRCQTGKSGKLLQVMVRDVSSTGVGILHTEAIKTGEQFIVCLNSSQDAKTKAILCTVVRWQPLDDRLFAVGATFDRELATAGQSAGGNAQ
jgi:hypothetical protein